LQAYLNVILLAYRGFQPGVVGVDEQKPLAPVFTLT